MAVTSDRYMRVECPRCGRIWNVPMGTPDIVCNCHLYCEDGEKPSDCNMVAQSFSGSLGWPRGLHVGADSGGDDELHRTYYCTVHEKYSYKTPVIIECDWERWWSKRAPRRLRMSQGEY